VQIAGVNYLSLAEVQVFGTPVNSPGSNIAQGKPASQSSTYSGTTANTAVDGSTDGNFFNNSVTHTNLETNAWWQVDLGASSVINSIVIWNRTDCCSARLNDYWVFVSDTPFSPSDTPSTLQNRAGTFSSHQITTPTPSATIPAVTQGRYVRVQLNGANYLSLAEVQVQ
jgi:alpha-L-fucosidase